MKKQKISAWIETLDSHGIYEDAALKEDFRRSTGREPSWKNHTLRETVKIMKSRGVGGYLAQAPLASEPEALMTSGMEVAVGLAECYAKFRGSQIFSGLGFKMRAAIRALQEKGL